MEISTKALDRFLLVSEKDLAAAAAKTGKEFADSTEEFRGYLWKTLADIAAYEDAIFRLVEAKDKLRETGNKTLQASVEETDRLRTICHNSVIDDLKILNRLSVWVGIPSILPGIEQMERKEIAMAAFSLQHHMAEHCY